MSIHLETGIKIRHLPPCINRRDQGQAVGDVRRVAQKGSTLMQGFTNQIILFFIKALHRGLKITNAAMNKLGASARCTFTKIIPLHQRSFQPARRSIKALCHTLSRHRQSPTNRMGCHHAISSVFRISSFSARTNRQGRPYMRTQDVRL